MQEQQFMVLIYITSSMCRSYGNVEIVEGQTRVFGLYYFESVANLALVFKLLSLLWARQAVRIQHKLSFSIHAVQSLLWVKKHFFIGSQKDCCSCLCMDGITWKGQHAARSVCPAVDSLTSGTPHDQSMNTLLVGKVSSCILVGS